MVVDPIATNAEVAADLGLEFPILADPEMRVIDAYDLRHRGGHEGSDIARPATFVIDRDGVVRWRNLAENLRNRPRPEEVVAQVEQLPR